MRVRHCFTNRHNEPNKLECVRVPSFQSSNLAHFKDWPTTLDRLAALDAVALVPGRGAALASAEKAAEGIAMTRDFLSTLYGSVAGSVQKGRSLKDAFQAARQVMDPKFATFAIYEHCLPFNVSRAYDEAKGIDHPVIWTAERDREMWAALQGG